MHGHDLKPNGFSPKENQVAIHHHYKDLTESKHKCEQKNEIFFFYLGKAGTRGL